LVTTLTDKPTLVLLLIVGVLVVPGMFLEWAANILLVTPIVMPVLASAGYDPIHIGLLIVLLNNLSGLTPPLGDIMFTVCRILDVKTGAYTRASLPFFLALAVFFMFLATVPILSTALPNALM
jgi:TRAP-type transport system large permease protein